MDALLREARVRTWIERWGRPTVVEAFRNVLGERRQYGPSDDTLPDRESLLEEAFRVLRSERPGLRPVMNGTGVILHTNLGRAPLSEEAAGAAKSVAQRYSNIEFDLRTGRRGERYAHCTELLRRLTGSEAALVVNNNAAAVSLAINELARGRDVIVSRGELVEIGGGFRIPDVVERSGGFLVAVGTTNRTRVDDFRRALTPSTGLLLRVHPSNYRVEGFVEEAQLSELVSLGRGARVPVMFDLGAGILFPERLPVRLNEPTPGAAVDAGVDLITWSGDKLLGGPQAGVLHGRASIIDRLRTNPLLRAFRVDAMTVAALESTLRSHLDPGRAIERVPALRMLAEPAAHVEQRARGALVRLDPAVAARVRVVPLQSVVGGGSCPGLEIESSGWLVEGPSAELDKSLRQLETPLVGRIEDDTFRVDFRTLLPGEEQAAAAAISRALSQMGDVD